MCAVEPFITCRECALLLRCDNGECRRVQEVGYKLFILPGTVAIQRSDIDDDDLEQVS